MNSFKIASVITVMILFAFIASVMTEHNNTEAINNTPLCNTNDHLLAYISGNSIFRSHKLSHINSAGNKVEWLVIAEFNKNMSRAALNTLSSNNSVLLNSIAIQAQNGTWKYTNSYESMIAASENIRKTINLLIQATPSNSLNDDSYLELYVTTDTSNSSIKIQSAIVIHESNSNPIRYEMLTTDLCEFLRQTKSISQLIREHRENLPLYSLIQRH